MAASYSINIGLPSLPEVSDKLLFQELSKVYNAINLLAQTIDSYTGEGAVVTDVANKADNSAVVHNTGDEAVAGIKSFTADLLLTTVGKGFRIKEGADAKQGVVTLVAGTLVVANTSVTATSRIFLTSQVDGGAPGFLRVSTRVVGVSFTVLSSSVADTSTVAYVILEPA